MDGEHYCTKTSLTGRAIDKRILEDIKSKIKVFIDESKYNLVKNEKDELSEQIRFLENSIEANDAAWKNAYTEYADGKISKEEYLEIMQSLKKTKKSLEENLEDTKERMQALELGEDKAEEVKGVFEKFMDQETLTDEIKQYMVDKVLVYDEDVFEIMWKFDLKGIFEKN